MWIVNFFTSTTSIFVLILAVNVSCVAKDVVFVVEASNNLNQEAFNYTIDFIYDVTGSLTIGPSDTQVSVLTFNSDISDHFVLKNCTDLNCVQERLDTIKSTVEVSSEDSTKTADALAHVEQTSLQSENGDRSNVENLVFVIVYGKSDSIINTFLAASSLKQITDVTVYAFGIGSLWDTDSTHGQELNVIASNSSTINKVSSYTDLCSNVPVVTKIIGNIDVSDTCVITTTTTTTTATTTTTTSATTTTTTTTATIEDTSTSSSDSITNASTTVKDSSGDAAIIAGVAAVCTLVVAVAAAIVFAKTKINGKCNLSNQSDHQHMYIVQQYPDAILGQKNCKFKC